MLFLLWGVTALSTLLGAVVFCIGWLTGEPQTGVAAAVIGIALAVVPYVLARAVSEYRALLLQDRQESEARKAASAG